MAAKPVEPHARRPRDEGAALVLTLMVITLVGVLATTVMTVTINNLGATARAQASALALDAADAGLTQSVARLRSTGGRGVGTSVPCTRNGWSGRTPLISQPVPGAAEQTYETWIATCSSGDPAVREFLVTSRGRARGGVRVAQQEVVMSMGDIGVPLGVFGRSIQGAGTPDFEGISVFSTGCVWNRSKMDFGDSIDAALGIPAAVHSSKIITDSNGNTDYCAANDNKAIHKSGPCPDAPRNGRGTEVRYDQDAGGGPCPFVASLDQRYYANGTKILNDQDLLDRYNIDPDPFPPAKLDMLRTVAQSQVQGSHSNYYTSASGWSVPDPALYPDSVLFFDLKGASKGAVVDLKDLGNTWQQTTTCAPRSLLIVIENGNVRMNGNNEVAASVVLTSRTYGDVDKGNGTPDYVGTIYANTVNFAGNFNIELNSCFLSNLSPHLYSAELRAYSELDR